MRNKFDLQLEQLHLELIKMGALCEEAISAGVKALLDSDDVTVVNLEGVLSDSNRNENKDKTYRFRGPTAFVDILTRSGIEAAVENLDGEEETAKRLLEKYMRGKPRDKATLYKAFRYLLGKGFEYETARAALAAFGDTEEE